MAGDRKWLTRSRTQIDDLEKEWTWNKPFDFIFSRMMTGSFANNESIVQKVFEWVVAIAVTALGAGH